MRRSNPVRAILLFILLTAVPSEGREQMPIPQGEIPMMLPPGRVAKTGTGRLRGRVVAADTGSIVRRAQVRISSPDIGSKTAFTDAQGRYEFQKLPAGRFNVSVSKSGFVTMQYGQTRPFEPGRPIDLVDAQVMEKADVALPRGSVVSGRILDEFGEPVADANVAGMRMQYSSGKRRLVSSGRASTTNDLGQFRLFGLPPGEYYVSVTVRSFDNMMMDMFAGAGAGGPTGSNNNSGYAATYYPGHAEPGGGTADIADGRPGAREHRHPDAAGTARENHRKRRQLRRQADERRDGHADAGDEGRAAVHARRHVADRQGRQLHAERRRARRVCGPGAVARGDHERRDPGDGADRRRRRRHLPPRRRSRWNASSRWRRSPSPAKTSRE